MNGTSLFEVSKLLRHASIQMTERYAHLAPDHLQNAIPNLGFSSQFHLTPRHIGDRREHQGQLKKK
jgi:hypothetical protein